MNDDNAAKAIDDARRLFAQGRYAEAARLCESVAASSPHRFDALLILGNSLRRIGRVQDSIARLSEALRLRAGSVDALYALGLGHLQAGSAAPAADFLGQAVAAAGGRHPDAQFNRGIALAQLGRFEESLACLREVRASVPASALVLFNEGQVLGRLGRFTEELACYDEALKLEPRSAELLVNRGAALRELGRDEEALGSLDRAIALDATIAAAHSNRAALLLRLKRHQDALAGADQALALVPGFIDALNTRGIALHELRRLDEALRTYDRVLAAQPDNVDALANRAITLADFRRHAEAIAGFERALSLKPDDPKILGNLAGSHFECDQYEKAAQVYERLVSVAPTHRHAAGSLIHSRMQICDWRGLDAGVGDLTRRVRSGEPCVHPFQWLGLSDDPADQLLAARTHANEVLSPRQPLWNAERYSHPKIRIAYVSADFREHAIGYLVVGMIEAHDRERFEVTAISIGPRDEGPTQKRIERSVDRFVDARALSDAEIARLLRSNETDIVVDLTGYTKGERSTLFALRPAPVQVNYLGYPGTLGSAVFDYIIADSMLIPDSERHHYAEKVVRLPHSYQATDRAREIGATPSRQQAGLPESAFVLASFNNPYKITPQVFEAWMRLLGSKEGSVLWLLQTSEQTASNLRREAAARGIAGDRLIFAPKAKVADHLARIALSDLCLDTAPYGGHTTTSDSLWAGVPVVTCLGKSFPSRVAASLLRAVGLPEMVAATLHEYEQLAGSLSHDAVRLKSLREKLARQRLEFPLFDTLRFTRHIEAAYSRMHEQQRAGLPPEAFDVPA